MYLVDTNVVSAAAPSRPVSSILVDWMDTNSTSLFMSAVTVTEIEDGIAKLRREKAVRRSADLTAWLETILHLYGSRILAFDATTARVAGALSDRARGLGHSPGLADVIIAATARQYGLTILSRNLRHFEPLGVAAVDPFVKLPR